MTNISMMGGDEGKKKSQMRHLKCAQNPTKHVLTHEKKHFFLLPTCTKPTFKHTNGEIACLYI